MQYLCLLPLIDTSVVVPGGLLILDNNNNIFTSDTKALKLLIDLFVERNHSLWKEPEVG